MKKIRTIDGSLTLFSDRYKEPFHSVTAGAFTESIEKFCKPCRVREKAKAGRVNLFDVCFGLGYNCVSFIDEALSSNPKARLFIFSVEKDLSAVRRALSFDWGRFALYKPIIKQLLSSMHFCKGFSNFVYEDGKVGIRLVVGDGREVVRSFINRYSEFFDVVFHDPFSPKVNPEMWTYEFFFVLRKMVKKDGILATYSASSSVRRALLMAGFGVAEGVAVGRRSKSTVASPSIDTSKDLLKKLEKAIPFRDPGLKDSPELISSRREGCKFIISKNYVQPECLSLN